jgi:hypothetical protein
MLANIVRLTSLWRVHLPGAPHIRSRKDPDATAFARCVLHLRLPPFWACESPLTTVCKEHTDQQWHYDQQSKQIAVEGAWPGPQKCLAVSLAGPRPPAPPAPPGPSHVTVDFGTIVNTVDERFVSFALDGSYNRGWFQRNLSNPKLRFLAKQLAPAFLRHGGSGNDYFEYDLPADSPLPRAASCVPGQAYPSLPGTSHCPPWSDSKSCDASAATAGFCAAAAQGPEPNCCHQCNKTWDAGSYHWLVAAGLPFSLQCFFCFGGRTHCHVFVWHCHCGLFLIAVRIVSAFTHGSWLPHPELSSEF